MRPFLTVGLLALLAAAPAAAGDVPVLAGTTVISGDRSGYVEVELAEPVHAPEGVATMTMEVSGPGYLRGGKLLSLAPPEGHDPWPQGAWFADPDNETGGTHTSMSDGTWLEPGRYRLYLITEQGIPTTLTLSLYDLEGRLELTPTNPIPVDAGPFEAHRAPDGYVAAGRFVTFQSHGPLWYSEGWDYGPGPGKADIEHCRYTPFDESPPPAEPWTPGCNGQWQHMRHPLLFRTDARYQHSGALMSADAGHTFGFGLNAQARPGEPLPRIYGYAAAVSLELPPELTPPRGSGLWNEPTPPPEQGEPTAEPAPQAAPAPAAEPAGRAAAATQTHARVRLRCAAEVACAGWASVRPDRSARVSYRIRAGARRTLALALTRLQARRLRTHGRLRATLHLGTAERVSRQTIVLRRPRTG